MRNNFRLGTLLTGKNIIRFTLILFLLATLFPPHEQQSMFTFTNRYFLPTLVYPAYFIAWIPLVFEYLIIILIGLILYTFKRD
jgi:hypothetical protein